MEVEKEKFDSLEDKEKSTLQSAIEIFQRIYMAVKISKLYDANNRIFLKHIETLGILIERSFKIDGEATFHLRQGTLFFNSTKIKTAFSEYHLLKYIIDQFQKWQIGILSFNKNASNIDLLKFTLLFGKKPPKTRNNLKIFREELKNQDIKNIIVEKARPQEQLSGSKQDAAKIFFLSVTHIKEVFNKQKEEKHISLLLTRRLIQSIFNHLTHNEHFLYGMTTIKNFDEYTLNHSVNVSVLSLSLGKRLGLQKNELADLGISAFFHDLGKVDIPKEILIKPGKLDDKELEIMRKHPQFGAEKLIQMNEFHYLPFPALNVAMEHHASDNKGGYPVYLKKSSINFYSKIVKVADIFDALTTQRPYRKRAFTRSEALNLMSDKMIDELDPLILKVFINMMGACPVGSLVLLDTAEVAVVTETNPETTYLLRPKVIIIADKEGNRIHGETVDLVDNVQETNRFKRSIVKILEPSEYDVNVSDYFMAEVE